MDGRFTLVAIVAMILVALFLSLGVFKYEVVSGIDAPVIMQIQGYDSEHGALVTVSRTYGTYKTFEKTTIGAYTSSIRFYSSVDLAGWTKELCQEYGGLWEYESECYFPSDAFSRIGINNLEVTKSTLSISCGWCPNSFVSSGVSFGSINKEDITVKPNGFWFKGILEDMEVFSADQQEVARKNCGCQMYGSIWVKTKEPCVPEWQCTAWGECQPTETQLRSCTDMNSCGTDEGKPLEIRSCEYTPAECLTNDDCKENAKVVCADGSLWYHSYLCVEGRCVISTNIPPASCFEIQPQPEEQFDLATMILIGMIVLLAVVSIIAVVIRLRR